MILMAVETAPLIGLLIIGEGTNDIDVIGIQMEM